MAYAAGLLCSPHVADSLFSDEKYFSFSSGGKFLPDS
jgi:hypothetical protein